MTRNMHNQYRWKKLDAKDYERTEKMVRIVKILFAPVLIPLGLLVRLYRWTF